MAASRSTAFVPGKAAREGGALATDALVEEAGSASAALLRAVTLFGLPVPEPVIDVLAGEVGGSVARLRELGLLAPRPDRYDPGRPALAADPVASGRLEPLRADERAALAALTVGPLFAAWGGATPRPRREGVLDVQLTRLAVLAGNPDVAAACAGDALLELRGGPPADAFRLGHDAIDLLDRHERPVPLLLLRESAAAALVGGDGRACDALLDRAARQAQAGTEEADPLERARVRYDQGRRLLTRGQLGLAEESLRRAHDLFAAAGSDGEAVVAMGSIADIAFRRGQFDEALRIRHDICLPAFERLGDAAAIAVTWGKIADIAFRRGDFDEALRIRREVELPAFERLGNTQEASVTWGKVADIAWRRGDLDEALRIRRDICLPAFERSGNVREMAVCWHRIADVAFQRGHYDEAARLQRKVLDATRQLADLDGIAAATWDLARIDLARGDDHAAIAPMMESFTINRHLQRPDGMAIVGMSLGELLLEAGQADRARPVLAESLAAATMIGWTDVARQISALLESAPPAG
jgi:tetratricopeptide (TPR) repeat protein